MVWYIQGLWFQGITPMTTVAILTQSQISPTIVISQTGSPGASGSAAVGANYITFNPPASGQTTFTLPAVPTDTTKVFLFVSGVRYGSAHITIAGNVITWQNLFTIQPTDTIEATY